MDIRLKGILIFAVLAIALFFTAPTYQAYFTDADPQGIENKVNLGLDLQGGMYLDLEVDLDAAVADVVERTSQELEDLFLDNQVNYLTVESDSKVNQVIMEFPANEQVNLDADPYDRFLVQYSREQSGQQYTFTLLEEEVQRIKQESVDQVLEVLRNRIDSLGVSEPTIQKQGDNSIVIQLPGITDRDQAMQIINRQAVLKFYLVDDYATATTYNRATSILRYEEVVDPVNGQILERIPYVLEKRAVLGGEFIRDARANFDQYNQAYVSMSFDGIGTERFASITRKNRGRRLAIVLDEKVQSAPVIREAITGGEAQITGQFTPQEATNLGLVLKSGALKAPIQVREEHTVGASLGDDSVKQGLMSLLIGGVFVLIFMTIYYRVSGLFANFALLFNIILIIAILAGFGATLTLPGMAGIVLTIGMAVDANVLIFERIREELRRSGHPRAAVNEGFGKAFQTILDANITTLIGAIVLFQFGTGPIKGFAITLSVGILASMFTAIVVTRFMFEAVYLNRKHLKEVSIGQSILKPGLSLNFIGKRTFAAIFSAVIILVGVGSIVLHQGLNYGIDFRGGTNIQIQFNQQVSLDELRDTLKDKGLPSFTLQAFGEAENNEVLLALPVDSELGTGEKLTENLNALLGSAYSGSEIRRVETIGPKVGDELKQSAINAILIALALILVYVSFRFHWKFGVSAIVTLVHDVLVVVGIFSLFDKEFSLAVVAALLTVVGYSLNDTIVVFDRIRENMGRFRKKPLEEVINLSINETLSRTFLTSVTTLFVVLSLFILGGAIISDFSFALLIGILIGTYSSIFVASPLIIWLNKRFSSQTREQAVKAA